MEVSVPATAAPFLEFNAHAPLRSSHIPKSRNVPRFIHLLSRDQAKAKAMTLCATTCAASCYECQHSRRVAYAQGTLTAACALAQCKKYLPTLGPDVGSIQTLLCSSFLVVYYYPLPKNHNRPEKELHWSPGVSIDFEPPGKPL